MGHVSILSHIPATAFAARLFAVAVVAGIWPAEVAAADIAAEIRHAAERVNGHPRLFMSREKAAALPAISEADALNVRIANAVLERAGEILTETPVSRELQGRRMLHISREALDRILTLAMAWHLRGDQSYLDRAVAEMRAIAAFDDWHPPHFLDTAEMTLAAAIGYDWLHAELDDGTRDLMRQAILEKGLAPALSSDKHWWIRTTNNWNQVCHGGLVAGALVVLDHHPEEALRIIERAVRHLPNAMAAYAPAGAYPEGPSYWSYGTTYNVILLAMLESALGTTFGLENAEGFDLTGSIPMLMTGPSGLMFNYADGHANRHPQAAVYWLARRFGQPAWAAEEDRLLAASGTTRRMPSLTLLWRDPAAPADPPKLPLHWTSRCEVPVSIHRESWEKPDATFFAIKAGPPDASHGQMDAGSFVLDAGGVRWAHDLGMENYHQVESQGLRLWSKEQEADRWKVFRNNNFSHNTLVIDGRLQNAAGDSKIVGFSDDPAFPHSVVDLGTAYESQLDTAHRGIAMLPGGSVIVRDHLTGLRPGAEVRWGMVTRAAAPPPDGTTLVLEEKGRQVELTIHGDAVASWQVIDISEPVQPWDSPNPRTSMVAFTATAPASGVLDITVVFRPGDRPAADLAPSHLAPPQTWSSH